MARRLEADNYFAMIPEWVIYSKISHGALRVYAVLARHTDKRNECFPSRKLIAEKCNVTERQVDRLLDELIAHSMVRVRQEAGKGQYRHNVYTLITSVPVDISDQSSFLENPVDISDENDAKNVYLTKAIEHKENEPKDATAKAIAKAWWDSRPKKPMGSYVGLVKIVQRAVDAEWTNQQIETALATFNAVPAVWALEAALNGAAKNTPTLSERDNRVMEILAMARAEREKGMNNEG